MSSSLAFTPAAPARLPRDLRVDFFRGAALLWVFINHIPHNVLSWLSSRNYGFSDATELFVLLSGFSAAAAYKSKTLSSFRTGLLACAKKALEIYAVHLLMVSGLLLILLWLALEVPGAGRFVEETNVLPFLSPLSLESLAKVYSLDIRPYNMDVLPLYVALMLALPLLILGLTHRPWLTVAVSVSLWLAGRHPLLASGWVFNPWTWQLMFVAGAALALHEPLRRNLSTWRPWVAVCALLVVALAFLEVLSWHNLVPSLYVGAVAEWVHPISKPNLDLLRVLHFAAAAWLAVQVVTPQHPILTSWLGRFLRTLGGRSLRVFSVGVLMSFICHVMLEQTGRAIEWQIVVTAAGAFALYGVAKLPSLKR